MLSTLKIALGMVALSGLVFGQLPTYGGPGVLSRGAQSVGNRGGQQVALRYSAGLNGVYDTGLLPLSLDSNGKLTKVERHEFDELLAAGDEIMVRRASSLKHLA